MGPPHRVCGNGSECHFAPPAAPISAGNNRMSYSVPEMLRLLVCFQPLYHAEGALPLNQSVVPVSTSRLHRTRVVAMQNCDRYSWGCVMIWLATLTTGEVRQGVSITVDFPSSVANAKLQLLQAFQPPSKLALGLLKILEPC